MQTTSALYESIVSSEHEFQTKVVIHETNESHDCDEIISISRVHKGMPNNKPSIGSAISATIKLTIIKPIFEIPKQAQIDVLVRAKNKTQTSEWIPTGTFFVDTRKENKTRAGVDTISITGYDAMIKTEADYPNASHNWPYLDVSVVSEIASAIGVTVDSRTEDFLTSGYMISLPLGYTMRETLEHIASAYGGNFVITADNKLLFVPLYGLAPEEKGSYLAFSAGTALTFGDEGWYMLV